MQDLLTNIKSVAAEFIEDAAKRVEGNKAAGARSRKSSLALTAMLKEWRKKSTK